MPDARAMQVNGKLYYDVKTFAQLTNRTSSAIYHLIDKGNALRRLRADKIMGKPLIPIEELTEYPFTAPGPRGSESVFHFPEHQEDYSGN